MQTSYFSLGKPVSEISTKNSTPFKCKNAGLSATTLKKKIQTKKAQFKALDFSQQQSKTPSTPSLKGRAPTSVTASTKKRKINRKLPVPPKAEPSVTSKITDSIQMLSEAQPNVNDFLLLNAKVNKFAASEVRDTNRVFAKLLSKFQNLPEAKDQNRSGATRQDLIQLSLVDKKFAAMDSIAFDDPAKQLQKMMAAARDLVGAREIFDENSVLDFGSEKSNCVKNVTVNQPGIRKKIKKDQVPSQSNKKSSKSNALARKSTFETSRNVSQDLFVNNGSGISLGYSAQSPEEEKVLNVQTNVAAPIVKDSEALQRKAKRVAQVDVNSMFGFSEAEEELEDSADVKIKAGKEDWNKFGFLFGQSSDSDDFSVDDGQNDEFACDFNVRPSYAQGSNVGGGQFNGFLTTATNIRTAACLKDQSDFAGWLERPESYGPMSLNYSDAGNMSPCLGLEHGGFEDCMEFR